MKSLLPIVLLVSSFFVIALTGCDDKKAAKEEATDEATKKAAEVQPCAKDSDCPIDWVCLHRVCSSDNTSRSNSVTAEKVRKRVEEIGEQADKRGQEVLDL